MTENHPDLSSLTSLAAAEPLYPPRNLPEGAEVVRVAPSPTGLPHLGTAMQCVIDRALANKTKGVFILRIEDTDQKRLVEDAVDAIKDGIKWLDLMPDEGPNMGGAYGPYVQSERLKLYQLAAQELIDKGHAYRCFCTPERLELMRTNQQRSGLLPGYDGLCRALSQDTIDRKLAEGLKFTVRMKMPEKTSIQFHDLVRGPITFESETQDDAVILKSDGFPTYHLAVVVDDHFMRVTTVVRGEEWISSAPKHVMLYDYFGWKKPNFLHTVLLRDAQKRKLSKRSGDTSIKWFEYQGYLPEGFRNFISRVMWAHPQEKDVYPYSDFIDLMKPAELPATGPVADFALLGFINGKYIADMTPDARFKALCDYFDKLIARGEGLTLEIYNGEQRDTIDYSDDDIKHFSRAFRADPDFSQKAFRLEPERIRRLPDFIDQYSFFFHELYKSPDINLVIKHAGSADKAKTILTQFLAGFDANETQENWENRMRAIAESIGEKPKAVFMACRLALTGREKSPPVFDISLILGRDETARRIQGVIQKL
jgi:glutamyl-tRNA synthetase